jgi:S1-C subfamily serine protease
MGRLGLLLFLFMPTHNVPEELYNDSFHDELYMFANRGISNAYTSSVIINGFNPKGQMAVGSGNYFQIWNKYFVMTAAHVVDGKSEIFLTERSGYTYKAKVVHIDKFKDLAILIPETRMRYTKAVPYRPARGLDVGREVFYCGNPNEMYFTSYHGRISGVSDQYILVDTFAWPGSSGSVVFNDAGQVVGVVSAISVEAPTGVPVLVPHFVRIGPLLNLSKRKILELISE